MNKEELCQNCKTRKATTNWIGRGSAMDFIHGGYERWCEYCVAQAQLFYAQTELERLPEHIKELKERIRKLEQPTGKGIKI